MAAPVPAAVIAAALAAANAAGGLVPPNNPPANTGRRFFQSPAPQEINIVKGNIFAYPADALVVVTDEEKLDDRQAPRGRAARRRWHTYAGPALAVFNDYNRVTRNGVRVPYPLEPETAIRVPSFGLANSNWVVMANPPQYDEVVPYNNGGGRRPGNTQQLYNTYKDIFHTAVLDVPFAHVGNTRPRSIVLPLMGSGAVGHDYDDAAGAAMDALFFFWYDAADDEAQAEENRARLHRVTFMVPTQAWLRPTRIREALIRALEAKLAAPDVALGIPNQHAVPAVPAPDPQHVLRSGRSWDD